MDARRSQVYTGLYSFENHQLVVVEDQMAVAVTELIEKLNEKGMMIILIGHVGVQEVKDPENQTYHRTAPRCHHLAEGMISQWCDAVLQAKQNFRIQKTDEGFGNSRGIATAVGQEGGERVVRTVGTAAVIAKNRYGLPEYLPLDFNAFYSAITENLNK
jgi:protein-L-isoaspartate O-methyltransferase